MTLRKLASAMALVFTACSSTPDSPPSDAGGVDVAASDGGDAGGDSATGALTLDPANTVLVIDAAKSSGTTATYSAKLGANDVSTSATFSVPTGYGTFTGAIYTAPTTLPGLAVAATTNVQASTSGASGSTKLSLIRLEASGSNAQGFVILPFGQAAKSLKTIVKLVPTFGSNKDISVAFSNNTANGSVDATKLIASVEALSAGVPALSCLAQAAKDTDADNLPDLFLNVVSGAPVCFQVTFKDNALVPAQAAITTLVLDATATGQPGSVKASAVPAYVFVPPTP